MKNNQLAVNVPEYVPACDSDEFYMVPPARLELTAHGLGNYGTPKNTPDTTENCYQQSQPKHLNTGQNTTQNDPDNVPPVALAPIFENIPQQLQQIPNWVIWRYEFESEKQRWTKVPYIPGTTKKASSTKPGHWRSFSDAKQAYLERTDYFDGVGFVLSLETRLVGIDFDDCFDINTGQLNDFANSLLPNSYAEISPSGSGIKAFVFGQIETDRKTPQVEVYSQKRFFTVTGHSINSLPISQQQPAIDKIIAALPTVKQNTNSSATAHGSRHSIAQQISDDEWREARYIISNSVLLQQLHTRLRRSTAEGTQLVCVLEQRYEDLAKFPALANYIFRADGSIDTSMVRAVAANGIRGRSFTFPEYAALMSTLFTPNRSRELWRQELAALWFKSRSPKRPPMKRSYMPPKPQAGRGGSRQATIQRVYEYLLSERIGVSALVKISEIALSLNCVERTVSSALSQLREEGKIITKKLKYGLSVTFSDTIENSNSEVIETENQTDEIQQNQAEITTLAASTIEETEETTSTEQQTVSLQASHDHLSNDHLSILREAEKVYGTNRKAIEFHIQANSDLSQAQVRELMGLWDNLKSRKWTKLRDNLEAKAKTMSRSQLRQKAKSCGSYTAQLRAKDDRRWHVWNLMEVVYQTELDRRDRLDNEAALARQAQAKPQTRYESFLGYSSWEISEMMWEAEKELSKLKHYKTARAVQLEA